MREKGWSVEIEGHVTPNHDADVVATKDGRRIIFEIETGKSDVIKNIEQSLRSSSDSVIAVILDADLTRLIQSQFGSAIQEGHLSIMSSRNVQSILLDEVIKL